MNKTIFSLLLLMLAVLAAASTFFWAQSRSSNPTSSPTPQKTTPSPSEEVTSSPTSTPSGPAKNASIPAEIYEVQAGDTLFSIGQKFKMGWQHIVSASGLADPNKIKIGDKLIIPSISGTDVQVEFKIDEAAVSVFQEQVKSGKSNRNDPIETAKLDAPPVYAIKADTSQFKLISKDESKGQATVQAVVDSNLYEIKLTQPLTKGSDGVWAIMTIKPVKS